MKNRKADQIASMVKAGYRNLSMLANIPKKRSVMVCVRSPIEVNWRRGQKLKTDFSPWMKLSAISETSSSATVFLLVNLAKSSICFLLYSPSPRVLADVVRFNGRFSGSRTRGGGHNDLSGVAQTHCSLMFQVTGVIYNDICIAST